MYLGHFFSSENSLRVSFIWIVGSFRVLLLGDKSSMLCWNSENDCTILQRHTHWLNAQLQWCLNKVVECGIVDTCSQLRNLSFPRWHISPCSQQHLRPAHILNKTISDGGITVDFSIIKVQTSNRSSNSWGSSNTWRSSNSSCWDHRIVGDHRIPLDL